VGELPPARAHLEQGLARYAPQEHRALAFRYGLDLGVWCLSYVTWPLWALGYPDQALTRMHEALTLAQGLAHPVSLAAALYYAALLHYVRREGRAAQACAEATIALSHEQGFPLYVALGTNVRGWALSVQGHVEEGMAQMRQGRAALQALGAKLWWPAYLAWLAEAYDGMGQATEGLPVLTEALTIAHNTGERFWEAELHRRKGALLLARSAEQHAEAEICFQQALDIARRQQAKSLELRAAVSLSRLWRQQGKHQAAHDLLAPIYHWFTEGFDTVDLQEAKALLDELEG
jgi:predicted ATPase